MFDATIIAILSLVVLLFSVIMHELAHGYAAFSLGDATAKHEGRLTLNPLKHLDMFGSIILPLILFVGGSPILFGWAKPVPINPYNFKRFKGHPRFGDIMVSLAGPASNFFLAIIFGLILRFIPESFILIYPGVLIALSFIVAINIWIAIFNLIPVPPLDGSWILFGLLNEKLPNIRKFLRQYGIMILVFLILFAGPLWFNIASFLFELITGRVLTG